MSGQDGSTQTFDPFSQFWTDMMGRMGAPGVAPSAGSNDWLKQMRKPFLEAMSRQAEEFMRSEQFLTAMKQSMDNALAAKQQVNQFLTKTLHDFQMPSSSDMDNLVLVMRAMEDRIVGKLEDLVERVERLEQSYADAGPNQTTARSAAKRKGSTGR